MPATFVCTNEYHNQNSII